MDAGKIYNSWPLMGLDFFPDDSVIINLFSFSAFNEPSLVQFMHRNLAYLIFILYLLVLFNIYNNKFFYENDHVRTNEIFLCMVKQHK